MTRIMVAVFSLFLFMSGPALAEDGAGEVAHDAVFLTPIARICLSPASGNQPAEETALDLHDGSAQACPPGRMAFLDYEASTESQAEPVIGIPPPRPYDQE